MAAAETDAHYPPSGHPNDGHHDVHMTEQPNGGGVPDTLSPTHLEPPNGDHHQQPIQQQPPQLHDTRSMAAAAGLKPPPYRDPMPKPNKVYIGNLSDKTTEADLQEHFGSLGHVISIELKVGYGFVEYDSIQPADDAVAKYHDSMFLGNRIKVEVSRGRKPPGKVGTPDNTGNCFKCGQSGHWARECPNFNGGYGPPPAGNYRAPPPGPPPRGPDPALDRMSGPRDYPPRDYNGPAPRDDYGRPPPPPGRYSYDYPPPPARDGPPPRDSRDYYPGAPRLPPGPPRGREYDDYARRDYRGPPGPPSQFDARPPYYPEYDRDPAYARPPYGAPAPPPAPGARDSYDRAYDRRGPAPLPDRFGPSPPAPRPRTPPGVLPPRGRDPYPPSRDYPPPGADYRRPPSPGPAGGAGSRYDYPPRRPDQNGYRRRSQSPPPRPPAAGYRDAPAAPVGGFGPPPSDRAPYGAPPYAGNGYSAPPPGGAGPPPMAGLARGPPPLDAGRRIDDRARDYPPPRGPDVGGYPRRS